MRSTLVLLLSTAILGTAAGLSLQWEPLDDTTIFEMRQDPCGFDNGKPLYICRSCSPNCIPGKIWILMSSTDNSLNCQVANNGIEEVRPNFQVLNIPPGVTSWVPLSASLNVNNTALVAGSFTDGEPTYICRGSYNLFDRRHLLVGKFQPSTRRCFAGIAFQEVEPYNVEILVINEYGFHLGYSP